MLEEFELAVDDDDVCKLASIRLVDILDLFVVVLFVVVDVEELDADTAATTAAEAGGAVVITTDKS